MPKIEDLLDLKEITVTDYKEEKREGYNTNFLVLNCRRKKSRPKCTCGSSNLYANQLRTKEIRDLDILRKM